MISITEQQTLETIKTLSKTIERCSNIQPKFMKGSPHHTLLKNRIQALRIAKALLEGVDTSHYIKQDYEKALPPIDSILHKTRKAQSKYTKDTSQFKRYLPMLQAMEIAKAVIEQKL